MMDDARPTVVKDIASTNRVKDICQNAKGLINNEDLSMIQKV